MDSRTRREVKLPPGPDLQQSGAGPLQRIWLERRKIIIFITHSIPEAVFLADRVVVLSECPGRIREVMPVDLRRPRDISTMENSEFVGMVSHLRRVLQSQGRLD